MHGHLDTAQNDPIRYKGEKKMMFEKRFRQTVAAVFFILSGVYCLGAEVIPGKTFELDFESSDGKAKFARGKDMPQNSYVTPDVPGVSGKAFRLTKDGKPLSYNLGGNAEVRNGTVNIWVKTVNYNAQKTNPGGWQVRPINLFSLVFTDKNKKNATARCYIYRGSDAAGVRFDFDSSVPPHRFGSNATTAFPLWKLQTNTWHMVTCTWDRDRIGIYFDGEYQASSLRSGKIGFIDSLKVDPDSARSRIMVRNLPKEQSVAVRGEQTDVDDLSIYDRVLSPAEIRYLFAKSKKIGLKPGDLAATAYQGTFRNGREYVKCDFDTSVLRRLHPQFAGPCAVSYDIFNSKGEKTFSGNSRIGKASRATLFFSNLLAADRYTVRYRLTAGNGKQLEFERSFDKPDTSWVESTAGLEDTTPPPWTKPVLGKDDSVSVWNRVYTFDGGPFPANVAVNGKTMLRRAPRLVLETGKGQVVPAGRILRRKQGGSYVRFEGELTAPGGFSAGFETMVDFDGFVQVDIKLRQPCPVKSMQVNWQVEKEFADYFMTPKVNTDKDPVVNFKYKETKILYFASEKGGFCYGVTGDANWVYDQGAGIYRVNKDTKEAELRVIQKEVVIPAGTAYQFCFSATPTRPMMKKSRAWRFLDGSKAPGAVDLRYNMYAGNGNLLISPEALKKAAKGPRSLQLYSASSFLVSTNLEARWFFDEWLMYSYQYGMGKGMAIPSCLNTAKANFLADNTRKSLTIPELELVDGYYFDCCGVYFCGNKMHGCGYTDSFGREVQTATLLALRSYLKRIIRLLHSKDRTLGAHGQFSFNPCAHSLCDYWLSGEELRGLAMKDGAEIYCDPGKVTDLHLRTNSNWRILSNVAVGMAYYGKKGQTRMPALTRLLLEDQKPWGFHNKAAAKRMDIMWKVFGKFKVDDGTVHRFFEQQEITADHPDLKITYYRAPDNQFVLIVGNTTSRTVQGKVDLSRFGGPGKFEVTEEIGGKKRTAGNGKISVSVPAQDFVVLTFRGKHR